MDGPLLAVVTLQLLAIYSEAEQQIVVLVALAGGPAGPAGSFVCRPIGHDVSR